METRRLQEEMIRRNCLPARYTHVWTNEAQQFTREEDLMDRKKI